MECLFSLLSWEFLSRFVSFAFWSSSYVYLAKIRKPDESPEWCSRVVTLLHGTVATAVGLWQCGVFDLSKCNFTAKLYPRHYLLMAWSWGYFAFDLIWCLVYWRDNIVMLFHHFSALIAITLYMGKPFSGCTFPCCLALMEITNPLLQARWFLRNYGYNQTYIYFMVEVSYLVLFITVRGIIGSYLLYKILKSDHLQWDDKLLALAFYAISIQFIYEILGYVLYKYKTKIASMCVFLGEFRGFLVEWGIVLDDMQ